jgi:stage IV sporulation protein FB
MTFYVFSVGRIPVHLSVWALILVVWMAWRWGDPIGGALVALGAITSVLIHELGHAAVAARYGLQPAILLHALGGTCEHLPARSDRHNAYSLAAGPLVQIAIGAVVLVASIAAAAAAPGLVATPYVQAFLLGFIYVSLFWGAINLAPMWPLDGGKLFRLGLLHVLKLRPAVADRVTHGVAIALAVLAFLAFWMIFPGSSFLVFVIFGLVAFQNVMALREARSAGPVRPQNRHANGLINDARAAFERGDWAEAARIGHQLRGEPGVPEKAVAEAFEIIALSHIFDGALDEGVRFARRAPRTPRVVSAWVQALVELGRSDEARRVLDESGAALPAALREELDRRVSEAR